MAILVRRLLPNPSFQTPDLIANTAIPTAPYAGNPAYNIQNVVWSENMTFAAPPNAATEAAWESLIPSGRGFIKHPVLAKETKAVAVFHELHCLVWLCPLLFPSPSTHLSIYPSLSFL